MDNYFETDILIVGGGPAGTSTALSLLKYSNLRVTIVEQSAFDTVRVGEQVNPSLFGLLEYLGIQRRDFEANSFIHGYSALAAWGSDRITTRDSIFSNQEESIQLDRSKFDLLLLEKAAKNGATIFPRTRCLNFDQNDDNSWNIDLKHDTKGVFQIQSTYLIDATGRQSNICRKVGVSSKKDDELVAIGTFVNFERDDTLKQDILIETIEEGWWYCATLPNQQVTTTLFTDASVVKEKQLHKFENWSRLLSKTLYIKNKLKTAKSCEKLWTRNAFSQLTNITTRKNFLAVGDAIASFDPISSMGIGFAISSGCHAAKAIIDTNNDYDTIVNYQENINVIYRNYQEVKSSFYQKEHRWENATFWERRLKMALVE
ncbi:MAG: lysine-epsilon-oxidase maturase LodB [Saprospiraceae bacterium]